LIGWFIYSDSFTTVVSIAILFAQSTLGAPKAILLGGAIIVPLFGGIGNWLWTWAQERQGWSNHRVLMMQSTLFLILPLWGIMGFFTPAGSFGLQNKYELLIVAAYHGLLLGSTQSTCRVFYSELIPRGHEAQFFGLYGREFFDRKTLNNLSV